MAGEFYSNDEVVQKIHDLLYANRATLVAGTTPVDDVYYGDVNIIKVYPAIVVVPLPMERTPRETGYFLNTYTVNIFIYHADMTKSKVMRNKEDLALARLVTKLLHTPPNNKLSGGVIQGWVQREESGRLIGPRGAVVGTRLEWMGTQREPLIPS